MTIDMVAGWWVIMSDDEVIAQLDSTVISQDEAYKIVDLIEKA